VSEKETVYHRANHVFIFRVKTTFLFLFDDSILGVGSLAMVRLIGSGFSDGEISWKRDISPPSRIPTDLPDVRGVRVEEEEMTLIALVFRVEEAIGQSITDSLKHMRHSIEVLWKWHPNFMFQEENSETFSTCLEEDSGRHPIPHDVRSVCTRGSWFCV
jgi:hypothetical protein